MFNLCLGFKTATKASQQLGMNRGYGRNGPDDMVEKIIRVISSPNLKYYLFMLSERDCDCDSVEVNESAVDH